MTVRPARTSPAKNEVGDRREAPLGRGRKVIGFAVGLAAAMSLNLFVGPRSAASHPTDHASPSPALAISGPTAASGPAVPPAGLDAKPSPGTFADGVPVADPPLERAPAHKASRAAKRHPPKHRGASKRR
jgi:hypothetical protein